MDGQSDSRSRMNASEGTIRLRNDGSEWDHALNMSESRNEWELTRALPDGGVERIRARITTFSVLFANRRADAVRVLDFVAPYDR